MRTARVCDAEPGADLSSPGLDDSGWLVVDVPGDLHRALTRAGRLPDLDHGLGNEAALWVEEREWWYRLDVPGPGRLTCHGLDTFATLYLDGRVIGESRNMFRPFEVDLDSGGVLAICFHRPLDRAPDVSRMRKAQYCYGWDFAPRRPTIGPWRPITLAPARQIAGVGFRTLSTDPVLVEIEVEAARGSFRASLAGAVGEASVSDRLHLQLDADLWSPQDPVLHELRVELLVDGAVVDTEVRRVGLRTIELDRDGAFRFVLNGAPLWVRGANWVPCDTAVADVGAEQYRPLLQAAKDANMNMIRVWGGGVYEHDAFYELCDELGLLVWQDFMFACAAYDDSDPAYVAEVEAEARYQVRRLRTRPSTALWCGNNEVELLARGLRWADPCPARSLFHELLPRVVQEEDGLTGYLPTSPFPGRPQDSDRHNWHVWHGVAEPVDPGSFAVEVDGPALEAGSERGREFVELAHPRRYLEDDSAFVSEYGLCGVATFETLRHWTAPEDLTLESAAVRARTVPGRMGPRNKLELLVEGVVGRPADLRHWVALSHLLQAEGVKVGAEHYRRGWPACGGSLLWQLDDCWPSTSWALVDVDGRRKPAFHAAARAFAPVLLSFTPDGTLWLSTDRAVRGPVTVRCRSFAGETAWEATLSVTAEASTSSPLRRFEVDEPLSSYLWVEGLGVRNRQLLADPVALRRPRPELTVAGNLVTASAYAFQVETAAGDCFDLEAGESREVTDPAGLCWL